MDKGEMTIREAGRLGGAKTKEKYGKDHFKRISKMGLDKRWGKNTEK